MIISQTRYSNPEMVYSQIPRDELPKNLYEAAQLLWNMIGANDDSAELEKEVSLEIIRAYGEDSGEPRPMHGVISRVLGLMRTYPFLIPSRNKEFPPKLDRFREWACNHIFDDLPGFYGISDSEGHRLRSYAQHDQIYEGTKPFAVNYQEVCQQIIEAVDLA